MIALPGLDTRPTTDRVKESVFNIISPYLPAHCVLDLFSGSGALGIEALSRGSEKCVFVENTKAAMNVTSQNIELAKVADRAVTELCDAFLYLGKAKEKFDIIFLDPPYNTGMLKRAAELIVQSDLLSEDGIIVAETEFGGEEPDASGLEIIKRAKYGKTVILILKKS